MGQILGPGFMISYILFSLPVGRMVDKFNRIAVLIGGIILWSIATAAHMDFPVIIIVCLFLVPVLGLVKLQ
ncbi:MAG: hypothetical protein CM15mP109_09110 [Candidatus Dadabacteria bacterium]|nr:MAG: hypothetical protein CM15mP109_09110 [Candidatus Dadabacteria bacterium]